LHKISTTDRSAVEEGVTGALAGRFVVLEGPDGCGKSTQARDLVGRLRGEGRSVVHLRDPGSTRVGEKIRAILLDREHTELAPLTETLLFLASRAQLIEEEIRPALVRGDIVVCERWLHSTVCYQGHAGGLDPEVVWRLGEEASGGISPDLTLVLDVDPAVGLSRVGGEPDGMESRSRAFHECVRRGYLEVAAQGRMGARLVPAGTLEEVAERIREAVADVL
jgi:dTMP kinase